MIFKDVDGSHALLLSKIEVCWFKPYHDALLKKLDSLVVFVALLGSSWCIISVLNSGKLWWSDVQHDVAWVWAFTFSTVHGDTNRKEEFAMHFVEQKNYRLMHEHQINTFSSCWSQAIYECRESSKKPSYFTVESMMMIWVMSCPSILNALDYNLISIVHSLLNTLSPPNFKLHFAKCIFYVRDSFISGYIAKYNLVAKVIRTWGNEWNSAF